MVNYRCRIRLVIIDTGKFQIIDLPVTVEINQSNAIKKTGKPQRVGASPDLNLIISRIDKVTVISGTSSEEVVTTAASINGTPVTGN